MNSNFPYKFMLYGERELEEQAEIINPIIPETAYVNPLYWYASVGGCPMGQIYVEAESYEAGWTDEQRDVIKVLLAHGIPLAGQMHIEGSTEKKHNKAFQFYSGGLVQGDCKQSTSNHQVTLVGYGTYKSTPVWVFQNSWGANWGIHGFYYIAIGSNAMCHEYAVYAAFPRYFRFTKGDRDKHFLNTSNYKDNRDIFSNPFSKQIMRGYNGLDYDFPGTYEEIKVSWQVVVFAIILVIFSLFVVYHGLVSECCPPALVIKPSVYVRVSQEEISRIKWADNCVRNRG